MRTARYRPLTAAPQSWLDAIGRRIEDERRRLRLSQCGLAERVGCCAAFVMRMEMGRQQPSAHMLMRVAKALGVSADYLLGIVLTES
jgi:transcriptional regulator with XRE-family HTH domain